MAHVLKRSQFYLYWSALVSVSVALGHTPAYTAIPRIRGWCIAYVVCLFASGFRLYSFRLSMEGWPGWVDRVTQCAEWFQF